ncbi:MAG: glycosyltransferase family 4 protein [Alphaproteobacteria bacterium]|nr:glycosyltransferase family 4 protein [Alphaproteobacteria bacterium]
MKILFIIKTMVHGTGGAERVLAEISGGLCAKGHDVSLLTFDPPGEEPFYPLHDGVRRIDLGVGDARKKSGFGVTLTRIGTLRKTVLQEKPDAVVAFMHSSFIPAAFALIGSGIPVIGSEHIVPEHYQSRKIEFFLFVLSSFFLKKITVVSEKVRESYPSFLQRKMAVVPNPVKSAQPDLKGLRHLEKRPVVLTVGRLDPQKDQDTLIRAFGILAPRFSDWDLKIIGEGELRPALEKTVAELHMKERVFLPGLTSDIDREYAAASLFVIPSRYESFGLATAEAMSYGLPAIGFSDCPGTNEVIENGVNGLLVGSGERTEALAQAMETLMSSEQSRTEMGQRAAESHSDLRPDRIVDLWEELIKRVRPS